MLCEVDYLNSTYLSLTNKAISTIPYKEVWQGPCLDCWLTLLDGYSHFLGGLTSDNRRPNRGLDTEKHLHSIVQLICILSSRMDTFSTTSDTVN